MIDSIFPGLSKLANTVSDLAIRYLNWLANDEIALTPRIALILFGICFLWVLIWLLFRVIQSNSKTYFPVLNVLQGLFFASVLLFLLSPIMAGFILTKFAQTRVDHVLNWSSENLLKPGSLALFLGITINSVLVWLSLRYWLPKLNQWMNERLTQKSYSEKGISDVRDVESYLPKTINYDPSRYWQDISDEIIIGLTPANQPVSVSLTEWNQSHHEVVGTTGAGKGIAVVNQLAQCLKNNQTVVVFAPKDDEFMPSVLFEVASWYARPRCMIDLNHDVPQFNLLYGAKETEIFDLLVGGFSLAESGTDADYFRTKERRLINSWHDRYSGNLSIRELASMLTDTDYNNAEKFCTNFQELSQLECLNTRQPGAWYDILDQGGLIYIQGSIRNEPILRLQKMLLLRIMQRLEARDRNQQKTHVTIFLDELKYLLSKPVLQALGTIRNKSANVMLAHQSLGDLRDVPADLDPEAVRSAVLENTAFKLFYRTQDPDTAEWVAKKSGTIPGYRETRSVNRNAAFSETTEGERHIQEMQRYLVDPNMILRMPQRCGVYFSHDPTQLVMTGPIYVEKRNISVSGVNPKDEPSEIVLTSPIQTTKIDIKPTGVSLEKQIEDKNTDFKSNGLDYFT